MKVAQRYEEVSSFLSFIEEEASFFFNFACMADYFPYGEQELTYLSKRDALLGEVIARVGALQVPVVDDLFTALANSIAGQQISIRAQESIWRRVMARFGMSESDPLTGARVRSEWKGIGTLDATAVASASSEDLRACGVSERKALYIQRAAHRFLAGEFGREELERLDDEALIQRLVSLDGVGRWTAEMLMIMSLQRPNILSYGDLGIQRGLAALHHHRLPLSPRIFERYQRLYSPFGTVASFYVWEAGRPS